MKINYNAIPNELKEPKQWVCWIGVENQESGKLDKIPLNAKTGRNASHSHPKTWSSYQAAVDFHEQRKPVEVTVKKSVKVKGVSSGIGFMFAADDPYVGIDLDNCRNPETGEIAEWALEFIKLANTYSEISPSATGVKMILKGVMPSDRGRKAAYKTGAVEMYSHHRFFTITGWALKEVDREGN